MVREPKFFAMIKDLMAVDKEYSGRSHWLLIRYTWPFLVAIICLWGAGTGAFGVNWSSPLQVFLYSLAFIFGFSILWFWGYGTLPRRERMMESLVLTGAIIGAIVGAIAERWVSGAMHGAIAGGLVGFGALLASYQADWSQEPYPPVFPLRHLRWSIAFPGMVALGICIGIDGPIGIETLISERWHFIEKGGSVAAVIVASLIVGQLSGIVAGER